MKIYFFIHIPKTAGTSFRTALQKNDLVHMFYDYGENSQESTKELIQINPSQLTSESYIFQEDKHNVLCGHANYQRYAHCVIDSNIISIVRNPIERLISEFQHLKRHESLSRSFEEFYSNPTHQNKQQKRLKGLELETTALIGLTSHYNYFVNIFSKQHAVAMDVISVNNAPSTDSADRFNLDSASIKKAYQHNKADLDFFFKLALRFAETVRNAGFNTIPPKGTPWNCRIVGSTKIVGWFSCTDKDCYFIVINVNLEKRVVIALDQYRQDILEKGMTDKSLCGFSYPLSLLGAQKGDAVKVEILGSQMFQKSLTVE